MTTQAQTRTPKNNQLPIGSYQGTITEIRSQGLGTDKEVLLIQATVQTEVTRPDDEVAGGTEPVAETEEHQVWMRWATNAPNGAYGYGLDRVMDLSKEAKLALTGKDRRAVRATVHSDHIKKLNLISKNVQVQVKEGGKDHHGNRYPNEVTLFPAEGAPFLSFEEVYNLLGDTNDDEEPAEQ